ncbi:hypothetical protein ACX0G9_27605 [Flavitalea flava]
MKKTILYTLCILVFICAVYGTSVYLDIVQAEDASELGFMDNSYSVKNILPMVYNAIAMLLGIVFGFFYTRFSELQRQSIPIINIGAEFKNLFKATSFYLALAASPIIFGIIIGISKGISISAALLLAFQNGFFWQNVMPKSFANPSSPGTPAPTTPNGQL